MRTYFFLLLFVWWLLLLLTFVPALMAGLVCGWPMRSLGWKRGALAGLVGGIVGVGFSMLWYIGIPSIDFIAGEYWGLLIPVSSVVSAWMICRIWSRRLR